ncbi:hypothetical protein FRC20_006569 [Serendipita sp. 405]|nr:hypothetical protein FRC20_006569 [Serendipita sp. 405]
MSPSLTSSVALELQALHNTGQTFPVVVKLMNATRWGHAAALALISYDTLLTVRDEIQYIWPMKLSVIKVFIYGVRALSRLLIFARGDVPICRLFPLDSIIPTRYIITYAHSAYPEPSFGPVYDPGPCRSHGRPRSLIYNQILPGNFRRMWILLYSGIFDDKLDHVGTYQGTIGRKQNV